jgi:hypothetical protein
MKNKLLKKYEININEGLIKKNKRFDISLINIYIFYFLLF